MHDQTHLYLPARLDRDGDIWRIVDGLNDTAEPFAVNMTIRWSGEPMHKWYEAVETAEHVAARLRREQAALDDPERRYEYAPLFALEGNGDGVFFIPGTIWRLADGSPPRLVYVAMDRSSICPPLDLGVRPIVLGSRVLPIRYHPDHHLARAAQWTAR